MTQPSEVSQLAAFLSMLKGRTDRSYAALAYRTGVSTSSLHRYCTGEKFPPSYALVRRFADTCGATQQEQRELARLWLRAYAVRSTPRVPGPQPEIPQQEVQPDAGTGDVAAQAVARHTGPRQRRLAAVGATLAVLAVISGWATVNGLLSRMAVAAGARSAGEQELLFSPACQPVVSMGDRDECVREVQTLLTRAGARDSVDGAFGPLTRGRVSAFQTLAGLPASGVVDEPTKRALYARAAHLRAWSPAAVQTRIRQVFQEEPDRAIGIALCQSTLDPLRIQPGAGGARSWGVFQLSDAQLREIGGTARQALDPGWNIDAAHRLWNRHRDFRYWPDCDQASRRDAAWRN
jgi:hypothetical protein